MKTNSNSYTIAYSAILVVIVAFLLAFVFQALMPAQDANVALDKKKQILAALNIKDLGDEESAAKYKEVVKADVVFTAYDETLPKDFSRYTGVDDGFKLNSADYKAGKYVLYVCEVNGQRKYVIPVYGMGLWGPIWGYIAVDKSLTHIVGAYFDHASETPGLGGKIKDDPAFRASFEGKELDLASNHSFEIVKGGAPAGRSNAIDAITGATMTSKGLDAAINDWVGAFKNYIKAAEEE